MKLSITQIALGILIILAACYVTGWMIHEAPKQFTRQMIDESGKTTYLDVIPEDYALFNTARYSSYLLPAIGIFLVIAGAVQAARGGVTIKNLAMLCIVAGVLAAGASYFITTWGYPSTFVTPHPDENNRMLRIFTNPGRSLAFIKSVSALIMVTGLAAAGIGIAQLVKSKKKVSV